MITVFIFKNVYLFRSLLVDLSNAYINEIDINPSFSKPLNYSLLIALSPGKSCHITDLETNFKYIEEQKKNTTLNGLQL